MGTLGLTGAFAAGLVLSMMTAAAATGSIWYGGLLLLVFGLGRALPLLIAGLSGDFVKRIEVVASYMP